jgi:hypothetical protein
MFKKSLLTLALVAASSNVMAAASVLETTAALGSGTPQLISAEGAVGNTSLTLGDITVNLDADNIANYSTLTNITVTLTGASFTAGAAYDVEFIDNAGGLSVASLKANGTVSYPTGSSAKIVMTGADLTAIQTATAADSFTIKGLTVLADSFDVGDKVTATVLMGSAVPGAVVESITDDATEVVTQFTIGTLGGGALFGITAAGKDLFVDVNDARHSWINNAAPPVDGILADEVTPSVSAKIVDLLAADASAENITFTVTTPLGFLDSDADDTVEGLTTGTGSPTVATDFSNVTETFALAGTFFDGLAVESSSETFTITLANDEDYTIPKSSTTVAVAFDYLTAAGEDASFSGSTSGGSWVLNGSSFTVPYMPFGPNTSPILSMSHTGTLAGEIFVEYLLEGGSTFTDLEMNGLEIQPGLTNLKAPVMDAVAAAVLADSGATNGKVAVRITVNAPSSDISAYAGFKVKHPTTLTESRVAIGTFGQLGDLKLADQE